MYHSQWLRGLHLEFTAMLVVLGRAATGAVNEREHAGLEVVTYYWHFVDVVWIALFVTLFVIR